MHTAQSQTPGHKPYSRLMYLKGKCVWTGHNWTALKTFSVICTFLFIFVISALKCRYNKNKQKWPVWIQWLVNVNYKYILGAYVAVKIGTVFKTHQLVYHPRPWSFKKYPKQVFFRHVKWHTKRVYIRLLSYPKYFYIAVYLRKCQTSNFWDFMN